MPLTAAKGRPDLKLQRASQLIDQLRESIDRYRIAGYQVLPTLNEDGHFVDFTLHVHQTPPLDEWALMFADCVHNMRAALDQLAWQLDSAPRSGSAGTSFPILTRPPSSWPPTSVGRMPTEAQEIIEGLQPFYAAAASATHEDPADHFLAIIQELDNSDKHRVLVVPSTLVHGDRIAGLPFGASTEGPIFAKFADGEHVMRVRLPKDVPITVPLRCEVFVEARLAEYSDVSSLKLLDDLFSWVRDEAVQPLMPFVRS